MNKLQEPVLVVDDEADIRDLMEMTKSQIAACACFCRPV